MFPSPQLLTVALAVLGGILALAASAGRAWNRLGPAGAQRLHFAAYALTGLSVILFVVRGLAG